MHSIIKFKAWADSHINFPYHETGPLKIGNSKTPDVVKAMKPCRVPIEPRREKIGFLHLRKRDKDVDQLRGNREADQRLCFRYIDNSTIPLLPIYEISNL